MKTNEKGSGAVFAILIVGVLLLSIFGLVAFGLLQVAGHTPDTDTIRKTSGGWKGGGQYPDIEGDDRKYGELFDGRWYYTSFDADGRSEKIIVAGRVSYVGFPTIECEVGKMGYWFYIHDGTDEDGKSIDDDANWDILHTDDVEGGKVVFDVPTTRADEFNAKSFNFKLDGLYVDGATIMVRFRIYCNPILGMGGGWATLAIDEARLIRGDGDLIWGKDVYTVRTDENAKLSWFVPGIDSDAEDRRVYKVFVTNENTGDIIYEKYVDSKSGSVNIPLIDDMAERYGSNRLIARLWNDIFQKDVTHVPVRIEGGFCAAGDIDCEFPTMNSITTDSGEYREGDTATITINATKGSYEIDHYFLLCEIEGTELINVETASPIYQVQVSIAGILECEATAYDIYGNPSAKRTVRASVMSQTLEDWCDDHPNDPACKVAQPFPWLIVMIAILLLIFLPIIFTFVIPFPPPPYNTILGFVLAIVIIFAMLLLGGHL